MSPGVLFIKLLLVHYATQSPDVTAKCNDDVPLMCPGVDLDSMNFHSVTWYKQLSKPKRQGIIRRDKGDKVTQYYNFTREVKFGEKYSLFLQSVKAEDTGAYECYISANVGSQNLNLQVNLTVDECVTLAEPTTSTNLSSTTPSNSLCNEQAQDLPVMWSIGGYVAVGITKIILSLISIWVIRAIHNRSERRPRQWGR